jgi:hypothetical protein
LRISFVSLFPFVSSSPIFAVKKITPIGRNLVQTIGVTGYALREIYHQNFMIGGCKVRSRIKITLFAILVSVLVVAGGCRHHRMDRARGMEGGDKAEKIAASDATADGKEVAFSLVDRGGEDLPEKEEIRRVYQLAPGSVVDVSGINGSIDLETADTEIAEVLIVRSANKREDLQFRQIAILHEPNRLRIRTEDDRKSIFSEMATVPEGKQRVILKVPHKVRFNTNRLNGNLTTGEIDGRVDINGVNGAVKIGQARGEAFFRGINGSIEATIAKLADEGVRVTGVNGNTKLSFIGDVNANIEASGFIGDVQPDLPKVEVQSSESMVGSYKARIGSGGVPIRVEGVNGNVYLVKAGKDAPESAKATAKGK